MITQIDKPTLKMLRTEMEAALQSVAAKHGITLRVGNMSYDAAAFKATVNATLPAAKVEQDRQLLQTFCDLSDIDIDYIHNGYKLVRYEASRRARPWVAEKGGKFYVFDDASARRLWAKKGAVPTPKVALTLVDNLIKKEA